MWRCAHSSASHSPSCAPWARPVAARHLLQRRSRQGAGPLLEPLPASLVAYKRSPPSASNFFPRQGSMGASIFLPRSHTQRRQPSPPLPGHGAGDDLGEAELGANASCLSPTGAIPPPPLQPATVELLHSDRATTGNRAR
jgi:hypothetical protein